MSIHTITPAELWKKLEGGVAAEIIDVRTPVEFRALHAKAARSVPLDQLDRFPITSGREIKPDTPIYCMCRSGRRAEQAATKLLSLGFTNVINVEGGLDAWQKEGLPTVTGKNGPISLERQVRIAAGMLSALGALFALTISPFFALLPLTIGSGLVFAGITDWCGMGLLLAKMPWNQTKATSNSST